MAVGVLPDHGHRIRLENEAEIPIDRVRWTHSQGVVASTSADKYAAWIHNSRHKITTPIWSAPWSGLRGLEPFTRWDTILLECGIIADLGKYRNLKVLVFVDATTDNVVACSFSYRMLSSGRDSSTLESASDNLTIYGNMITTRFNDNGYRRGAHHQWEFRLLHTAFSREQSGARAMSFSMAWEVSPLACFHIYFPGW